MKVLNTGISTASNLKLFEFTQGIDVDSRLFRQEIQVQKAWAQALTDAGYLTNDENQKLSECLDKALGLMSSGDFQWKMEDEDIHMNLERFMTENLSELGKKIHLGRSRNDLIASTLRLFIRDELEGTTALIKNLIQAVSTTSLKWIDVITPGMTHLQYGQPIRLGHLFSAHGFALKRDLRKIKAAQDEAIEHLPLGAAAFAGTHLPVDLMKLSKTLGFSSPLIHSYDAVGDRDYIIASLSAYASIAMHLSRYCEDVMYWASSGIKVMKLPFDWSTGSSIMPNKRNPDVPELVRAKMARVMAAAQEGLTLMRSVTPSYGSDIHELKRTFLTAHGELQACLLVLAPFTLGLEADVVQAKAQLNKSHILATDVANEMTKTLSFRDAYKKVAEAIKTADAHDMQIHEYFQRQNQFPEITFENSVEQRRLSGGTSRVTALAAIEKLTDGI
jgi:argininosuccinate lyase